MNYTGSMILFIFLVQLAAYTLKWLIGFGNPLISAPLLAMRLDNTLITPGSLLPDLVINGRITWQNRNNFRWRAILPLLLAMVAGVVPGTWLLRFSLPWIIKTVLGGVVVFLGLEMATRRLRPVRPDRREIPWLRYLVAFFSGMCACFRTIIPIFSRRWILTVTVGGFTPNWLASSFWLHPSSFHRTARIGICLGWIPRPFNLPKHFSTYMRLISIIRR